MASYWVPTYLQQFGKWLQDPSTFIFGRWQGHPEGGLEGGMDVGSPGGTPVYALADGLIQGVGQFWHSSNLYTPGSGNPGYGVVTERVNVPGAGLEDLYYQHIDINPALTTCYGGNCGNQMVHKGDLIGTIRDNVGMLEIGFNANWGGVWGGSHPGPWVDDPRPWVKALIAGGPPSILGGSPNTCNSSDPCLGCGTKGSKAYNDCLAASVNSQGTGNMPSCASCGTTVVQDAANATGLPAFNAFFQGLLTADWHTIFIDAGLILGGLLIIILAGYLLVKQ